MAKYKNIIHFSEVPLEAMKVPEGSSFGGVRQRVGAAIGAKKLGYSFFTVPPGKAAFPLYPDSQKIGAYVTSAAEGGFRALYRKDGNLPYFDGESGLEIERIKKSRG